MCVGKMHDDEMNINVALVRRLVATQFPQWANLPVKPLELDGWDNTAFRLGEDMSVRLPTAEQYALQVEKEPRWLPTLAPLLPLPIPAPLAKGTPGEGYPYPWSVYRWIEGVRRAPEPGEVSARHLHRARQADRAGRVLTRARPLAAFFKALPLFGILETDIEDQVSASAA
jgi:aminoglycoside phosphotransferase (APT) family kinase protein